MPMKSLCSRRIFNDNFCRLFLEVDHCTAQEVQFYVTSRELYFLLLVDTIMDPTISNIPTIK